MKNKLGQNIKNFRTMKKMEQIDLAKRLNVSNKTISSWERGRTEPKMGMIEEMCKIFECTKSELLEGYQIPGVDYTLTDEECRILLEYRKADDITRESVRRLLVYSGLAEEFRHEH